MNQFALVYLLAAALAPTESQSAPVPITLKVSCRMTCSLDGQCEPSITSLTLSARGQSREFGNGQLSLDPRTGAVSAGSFTFGSVDRRAVRCDSSGLITRVDLALDPGVRAVPGAETDCKVGSPQCCLYSHQELTLSSSTGAGSARLTSLVETWEQGLHCLNFNQAWWVDSWPNCFALP
jgi:hypothetical protein